MSYSIDWNPDGVHIKFFEVNTLPEIIEVIGTIVGNSKFDQCKYQLVDLIDVTELKVQMSDIPLLASLTKQPDSWNKHLEIIFISCKDHVTKFIDSYIAKMKELGIMMEHVTSLTKANKRIEELLLKNIINLTSTNYENIP